MARNNDRDRGPKRVVRDNRPRGKKKVCIFCQERTVWVDYKDINLLRRFVSDRGKIRSRRVTGNCAQHQREVQVAIKTAREVALLPYTQRTLIERAPGRGPRGSREREPLTGRSDPSDAPGDLADSEEIDAFEDSREAGDDQLSPVILDDEPVAARQLQESEV
jgi:small subunit ribosomal protein S18